MEHAFLSHGVEVDRGENARLSSLVGAMAIADLVKTTLGPKGMDKILQAIDPQDQSISVTNDGATILSKIPLDNPAAKVLVNMAKVQDNEVGDGTTSVAVFCGELLRGAEHMLLNERLHPNTIAAGWRLAMKVALNTLDATATNSITDEDLLNIAKTTLSSKLVMFEKEHFAKLCVTAVKRLVATNNEGKEGSDNNNASSSIDVNLDHINIIKLPGGSLRSTYLEEGFLLEKVVGVGQPKRLENCKILLANTSMDTDKIKIYGSRVQVDSLNKVSEIEKAEKLKMKRKCDKILNHGCNVFINRQLIYNYPESIFTNAGIMAIEHADFDGIERLAAVTGGEVVSTFEDPDKTELGYCDVLEEVTIGETTLMRFGGCKSGAACTIVLRGSSNHAVDEAERSIHDALCILAATLKYPRRNYGGGCSEVAMALAVDKAAKETPGKKSIAMRSYSKALLQLPATIADNGGYDAAELVANMQAAHSSSAEDEKDSGVCSFGLNMTDGTVGKMKDLGIMESYKSKYQVVSSASEAAEMIMRVDDIIKCRPRQREEMDGRY